MATLIFKTVKDLKSRFGNSEKIEFVKEGNFLDAMSHFDDQYNYFEQTPENEGFDSSIDEKGYYTDSNGDVIVTFTELKERVNHTCEVDGSYFKNYYTTSSDSLTDDELVALSNQYNAEDYFIENGYSKLQFRLAEYFEEFDKLIENGDFYVKDYFDCLDKEPEDGSYFEFEEKFYVKN